MGDVDLIILNMFTSLHYDNLPKGDKLCAPSIVFYS